MVATKIRTGRRNWKRLVLTIAITALPVAILGPVLILSAG
jgi:hypothetical protein